MLKRKCLLVSIFLAMSLLSSCSFHSRSLLTTSVTPNPKGTVEEQIAYHKAEIKKYQTAVQREEYYAHQHMNERSMSDVRASNNRKEQYLRKMNKHIDEMSRLQGKIGAKSL